VTVGAFVDFRMATNIGSVITVSPPRELGSRWTNFSEI